MAAEIVIVFKGRNEAEGAIRSIRDGLSGIGDTASSAGGRVSGFFSSMLSSAGGFLAANVIGNIATQFGGAITSGFTFNNTMEKVTAQLNAFTKDGAQSAKILEMIKARAAKTPFEFDQMAQAATALLPASKAAGVGLESLIAQAEILAASNPAEGLEGAAFALKEALSGDFASIIERFDLPRQRLNELKKQGVPALKAVQIAMKDLGLDASLVSNLAETAEGRWSTFKDTIVGVASRITQPIFDRVSAGLGAVNAWLEANQPAIEKFTQSIVGGVERVVSFISTDVVPAFQSVWNIVNLLATGDFAGGIFGLSEDDPFIDSLFTLRENILGIASAIQTNLNEVWNTVLMPIFNAAWETINTKIIPSFAKIGETLMGSAEGAGLWRDTLLPALQTVGAVIAEKVIPAIGDIVIWLSDNLPPAIATAKELWVTTLQPALAEVAQFMQDQVIPILQDVLVEVETNLPRGVKVVSDLWNNTLYPALQNIWSFIQTYLVPLFSELTNLYMVALSKSIEVLANIWTTTLWPAMQNVWDWITNTLMPTINVLTDNWEAVGRGIRVVTNSFSTLAAKISSFKPPEWLGKLVGSAGKALGVPGLASGVSNFGGGLAVVGERGRELVALPRGSSVIPNGPTERILQGGPGSSGNGRSFVININNPVVDSNERVQSMVDQATRAFISIIDGGLASLSAEGVV